MCVSSSFIQQAEDFSAQYEIYFYRDSTPHRDVDKHKERESGGAPEEVIFDIMKPLSAYFCESRGRTRIHSGLKENEENKDTWRTFSLDKKENQEATVQDKPRVTLHQQPWHKLKPWQKHHFFSSTVNPHRRPVSPAATNRTNTLSRPRNGHGVAEKKNANVFPFVLYIRRRYASGAADTSECIGSHNHSTSAAIGKHDDQSFSAAMIAGATQQFQAAYRDREPEEEGHRQAGPISGSSSDAEQTERETESKVINKEPIRKHVPMGKVELPSQQNIRSKAAEQRFLRCPMCYYPLWRSTFNASTGFFIGGVFSFPSVGNENEACHRKQDEVNERDKNTDTATAMENSSDIEKSEVLHKIRMRCPSCHYPLDKTPPVFVPGSTGGPKSIGSKTAQPDTKRQQWAPQNKASVLRPSFDSSNTNPSAFFTAVTQKKKHGAMTCPAVANLSDIPAADVHIENEDSARPSDSASAHHDSDLESPPQRPNKNSVGAAPTLDPVRSLHNILLEAELEQRRLIQSAEREQWQHRFGKIDNELIQLLQSNKVDKPSAPTESLPYSTIRDIALQYNVSVEALIRVNPSLHGCSANEALPHGMALQLPELEDSVTPNDSPVPPTTVGEIARQYEVSVEALIRANPALHGCSADDVLPHGMALQLPEPEDEATPTVTTPTESALPVTTIGDIARQYEVSVEALIRANPALHGRTADEVLPHGMALQLPDIPTPTESALPSTTIRDIARQYEVSVEELIRVNHALHGHSADDELPHGMTLQLPEPEPATVREAQLPFPVHEQLKSKKAEKRKKTPSKKEKKKKSLNNSTHPFRADAQTLSNLRREIAKQNEQTEKIELLRLLCHYETVNAEQREWIRMLESESQS